MEKFFKSCKKFSHIILGLSIQYSVIVKGGMHLGQVIPNKWKKHLVLVEFGLKKQEDLENEIHRYPAFHVNTLINEIEKEIKSNPNSGMYIISSIPSHDCFKLPNFCISCLEDLEAFKTSLDDHFLDKFSEVWYCKKPFQNGHDVITGRIALDNRKGLNTIQNSHTVEQVWNCSHREIEKFNKNSNGIYLRASREGWGRRYHIDALNLPSKKDKDKVVNGFIQTVKEVESDKEKIEEFENYLEKLGIEELCLEYMLSQRGFSFIDWDTSNDKKVIDSVFPAKEKSIC